MNSSSVYSFLQQQSPAAALKIHKHVRSSKGSCASPLNSPERGKAFTLIQYTFLYEAASPFRATSNANLPKLAQVPSLQTRVKTVSHLLCALTSSCRTYYVQRQTQHSAAKPANQDAIPTTQATQHSNAGEPSEYAC